MEKHYFVLWTKETAFFSFFFPHEITFYSAEIFDSAVNFKFDLNIFIFLNIKGPIFELRISHVFRVKP